MKAGRQRTTKHAYLEKLTRDIKMKSVKVGKDLEGSTPPSVFIGRWSYPKVYAGPMMANQLGDTYIMDSPESWLDQNKTQNEILNYRMNLVRGKQLIDIKDLNNPYVEKLQDISLASKSTDAEANFLKKPRGAQLSQESMPHGPSGILEKFDIDAVRWDKQLEKSYYDTDLRATDAVMALHNKNVPFSAVQKAFSVGAFGIGKNRKLVPTRWSITACDSALADKLLKEVRYNPIIDTYRVYENEALNNYYAIILTPTEWQYEWTEGFYKVENNEELVFSDYETNEDKKEYSTVGGCYYTSKMVVLDALNKMKLQSGLIVLREAYTGYVPMGVFNVRENMREAMGKPYKEFEDLKSALVYVGKNFKIPLSRYIKIGTLLNEMLHTKQTTLDSYFKKSPKFQN
ncbi:Nre family DNA repair protein [Methanobrevibacter wolinii]|uniref:Nre family DNA repair protein n=1 Tax=Methanobrevibacter wolinii TaxID=190977 RepID=UPI0005B255A6|nr:Nre family DNA repair protein [Methanobrevibacter wolinii]